METPHLAIKNYISSFDDIELLREKLLENGIYSKNYIEEGLLLIYTKYEPLVENKSLSSIMDKKIGQSISCTESLINKDDIGKLKLECRSLIIDTEKKEIVSYSCNTPICNLEAINYLLSKNKSISKDKIEKYKCYEGTLLSLFNHKGIWYISTRRNLDCQNSIWNNISYYDLFMDVLEDSNFSSFEDFVSNFNDSYCYYFILVHHKNKNIVDYSNRFGDNYKKLCLAFIRKKNDLSEVDLESLNYDDNNLESVSSIFNWKNILSNNIFLAERIEQENTNYSNFGNDIVTTKDGNSESAKSPRGISPSGLQFLDNCNELNTNNMTSCEDEGIIIKIKNENDISYFLKIQTYSYQFNKAIGAEKNIFRGFLNLYQNNQLVNYLQSNSNLSAFKKIINPLNLQESYDTIGTIDSVFKVCTSELYELFKILWDIKSGKQLDTELYKILPKEYKTILYYIRGIYFKKKHENRISMSNSMDDFKKIPNLSMNGLSYKSQSEGDLLKSENKFKTMNKDLQIKDIYQYLKKEIDTIKLEHFLRVRKLMNNWVKVDSENESLKKFSKISVRCEKVHLKLIAIFSNKLFPNIMPDDVPNPTSLGKSFGSLNSFGSLSSLAGND